MVSQNKLVSGCGNGDHCHLPPYEPTWLWKDFTFFTYVLHVCSIYQCKTIVCAQVKSRPRHCKPTSLAEPHDFLRDGWEELFTTEVEAAGTIALFC